ncbi:hypothetical protein PG990_013546 [Apiospora arundinis]
MDYHASGAMAYDEYPLLSKEGDLFLWKTGKYADVRIICQGQSMMLHRAILTRCPWFKTRFQSHWSAKDTIHQIRLDQFSPSLLLTVLSFIYSTQVNHQSIQPGMPFDYEVLSGLYNMGAFFEFEEFKIAIINIGIDRLNEGITHFTCGKRLRRFTADQIDRLLAGVRVAYSGNAQDQRSLRGIYVHFFTECYENLRTDSGFYNGLRSVPIFFVDLMENVNIKQAGEQTEAWSLPSSTTSSRSTASSSPSGSSTISSRSSMFSSVTSLSTSPTSTVSSSIPSRSTTSGSSASNPTTSRVRASSKSRATTSNGKEEVTATARATATQGNATSYATARATARR